MKFLKQQWTLLVYIFFAIIILFWLCWLYSMSSYTNTFRDAMAITFPIPPPHLWGFDSASRTANMEPSSFAQTMKADLPREERVKRAGEFLGQFYTFMPRSKVVDLLGPPYSLTRNLGDTVAYEEIDERIHFSFKADRLVRTNIYINLDIDSTKSYYDLFLEMRATLTDLIGRRPDDQRPKPFELVDITDIVDLPEKITCTWDGEGGFSIQVALEAERLEENGTIKCTIYRFEPFYPK